jgi:hypothetical protein
MGKVSFEEAVEATVIEESNDKAVAVRPESQVAIQGEAPDKGIFGEFGSDDIKLPRLNLVNKVGDLSNLFTPGAWVLKKEHQLTDVVKGEAGSLKVIAVRLGVEYQESLPYDPNVRPRVFATAEKQVFYGVGADAKGFAGLVDDEQLDSLSDTMVVNAGGSNVSTQTSCFLLRSGMDDVCFILGNDGKIVVEDEPTIIAKAGAVLTSATYPALYVPVTGYSGLQLGGAYSIARIANIECNTLTSTTAFTDDHIAAALSLFPAARMPNVITMNRNAQRMLRQSRTATNPTGAPAPFPTEAFGIPIVVSDQILSTEAVET